MFFCRCFPIRCWIAGRPGGSRNRRRAVAFTTDSFVVKPLFFPGGDIGSLAVHGTVNDLAMGGATPLYSERRLHHRRGIPDGDSAAHRRFHGGSGAPPGVTIVTGDTKVVERGKGDGVFINTTGIGDRAAGRPSLGEPGAARRSGDSERGDRRSRHGHYGAAAKVWNLRPRL
jgi:hydrogenase maturation factor